MKVGNNKSAAFPQKAFLNRDERQITSHLFAVEELAGEKAEN